MAVNNDPKDQDYSKSVTGEESDDHRSEQSSRSYECVFCKRGFTTAQALGGHMNIHRKDRVKNQRPNMNPSFSIHKISDNHEIYMNSRSYMTTETFQESSSVNYSTLFPSSTSWSERPRYDRDFCDIDSSNRRNSHHLNYPSQIDLSLGGGSSSTSHVNNDDDDDFKDKREDKNSEGDGELDLELRLGHDP